MDRESKVFDRRSFLLGVATSFSLVCLPVFADDDPYAGSAERKLTDAQWKKKLSPAAYSTMRQGGTEPKNSSALNEEHGDGTYACAGCQLPLFRSDDKFDAGTGWPSFYKTIDGAVVTKLDHTEASERTEYHCARCLSHQGYLFADGPQPWGLRYSNNGIALTFMKS